MSFFRQIRKTCSILWFTWVFFEFLEARRLDKYKFIKWNLDKFSSASADFWFDMTDCKLILENSNLQSWWCFRLFLWRTQHFPKTHIKVLRKIIIDLLYFWDVYDINLWGKKIRQKYRLFMQNKYLYMNFIVLRKNNRHSWRLNKSSKTFWINKNLWVFLNWQK